MYTMKGRDHGGKGPPAADLLVCFPSKAHLRLMPKPICSPSRPSEPTTRHHQHRHSSHHLHHSHLRKSSRGGHSSPLFSAKTKPHHHHQNQNSDISSEPTSPKVTCAGQIKVRKPASSCKNWQSVMEEIERLHNSRKQKKKSAWVEALGFKKEVMQFLTCLRNVRFDFRCFGSFPTAEITSDDDDDEDEDEDGDERYRKSESKEEDDRNSRDVFSKWFMILQENNQEQRKGKGIRPCLADNDNDDGAASGPPPANALLLMRCRSAPAKSWLEEKQEEEEEMEKIKEKEKKEEEESKESLVVMRCGADYSKLSNDIAKETWVVGGIKELLSRSRSCKR